MNKRDKDYVTHNKDPKLKEVELTLLPFPKAVNNNSYKMKTGGGVPEDPQEAVSH